MASSDARLPSSLPGVQCQDHLPPPILRSALAVQDVLNYIICVTSADLLVSFLRAVERELRSSLLRIGHPTLLAVAEHLCFGQTAKRARPRLVWQFGRCLGEAPCFDDLVDVAVAAELVHSSSLLHDDVIDESVLRRGRRSANAAYGNPAAVLGGDMTLTLAMQRLEPHPRELTTRVIGCVAQMTDAAISEIDARWRTDLDVEDWQRIASGKTAALLAWCGESVATLAGDKDARAAFSACARHLGIAFQLADDLIDVGIEAGTLDEGKARYADLRNGNANYAVIAAARRSEQVARWLAQLYDALRDPQAPADERDLRVATVGDAVRSSLATSAALGRVDHELALALDALRALSAAQEGYDAIAMWGRALCDRLHRPSTSRRKVV
ncbi:MAG: polyprenyl synthetase family protein [Myxococcales bacterium]|nr:polyprenyl synthetase family protein [Myxococcales bacterium]